MEPRANVLVSLVGILSVAILGLGAPVGESSSLVARESNADKTIRQICTWASQKDLGNAAGSKEYMTGGSPPRNDKDKDKVRLIDLYSIQMPHLTMNSEASPSPSPHPWAKSLPWLPARPARA